MIVRYSPRATRDLDAIREYLEQRSPHGAFNVLTAIYAAVEFVRRHPAAAQFDKYAGSQSEDRSSLSFQDLLSGRRI